MYIVVRRTFRHRWDTIEDGYIEVTGTNDPQRPKWPICHFCFGHVDERIEKTLWFRIQTDFSKILCISFCTMTVYVFETPVWHSDHRRLTDYKVQNYGARRILFAVDHWETDYFVFSSVFSSLSLITRKTLKSRITFNAISFF